MSLKPSRSRVTAERQYKIKLRTKWKKNVVSQKKERLDRIDEAFLHERSIDRQTYERQRDQLREQLALVEIELNDAVLDQLDIDGVLAFAEHVVTNAARLWIELDLAQKQRLQHTLFPEGLRFDGEKFGTAATCLAFKKLDGSGGSNSGIRPQEVVMLVGSPRTTSISITTSMASPRDGGLRPGVRIRKQPTPLPPQARTH